MAKEQLPEDQGIGPAIESAYNAKRDAVIGHSLKSSVAFTATPFCKGVLMAAAAIVVGSAIAAAGWFVFGADVRIAGGSVNNPLAAGLGGFNLGLGALLQAPVIAGLAVAGLLYAGMSERKEKRAVEEAKQVADSRRRALAPVQAMEPTLPPQENRVSAVERYNIQPRQENALAAYINEQAAHAAASAR